MAEGEGRSEVSLIPCNFAQADRSYQYSGRSPCQQRVAAQVKRRLDYNCGRIGERRNVDPASQDEFHRQPCTQVGAVFADLAGREFCCKNKTPQLSRVIGALV